MWALELGAWRGDRTGRHLPGAAVTALGDSWWHRGPQHHERSSIHSLPPSPHGLVPSRRLGLPERASGSPSLGRLRKFAKCRTTTPRTTDTHQGTGVLSNAFSGRPHLALCWGHRPRGQLGKLSPDKASPPWDLSWLKMSPGALLSGCFLGMCTLTRAHTHAHTGTPPPGPHALGCLPAHEENGLANGHWLCKVGAAAPANLVSGRHLPAGRAQGPSLEQSPWGLVLS